MNNARCTSHTVKRILLTISSRRHFYAALALCDSSTMDCPNFLHLVAQSRHWESKLWCSVFNGHVQSQTGVLHLHRSYLILIVRSSFSAMDSVRITLRSTDALIPQANRWEINCLFRIRKLLNCRWHNNYNSSRIYSAAHSVHRSNANNFSSNCKLSVCSMCL